MRGIRKLTPLAEDITESYEKLGGINLIDGEDLPSRAGVVNVLKDLLSLLFPGYFGERLPPRTNLPLMVESMVDSIYVRLYEEVWRALRFWCRKEDCTDPSCDEWAERTTMGLLSKVPEIREVLSQDVEAAYEGDPAAKTNEEIIVCYPFIEAIATHRIAHELSGAGLPLVPRIMSEWAHQQTGIDIHPGAKIGRYFFIDHGTGVVIGETAEIGDHVKIYQGVTLGALSFPRGPDGKIVKGGKRHPTIEDKVTIYSGATILGGDTVIGKGSVIGANAWVTSSVAPGTKVTIRATQEIKEERKAGSTP